MIKHQIDICCEELSQPKPHAIKDKNIEVFGPQTLAPPSVHKKNSLFGFWRDWTQRAFAVVNIAILAASCAPKLHVISGKAQQSAVKSAAHSAEIAIAKNRKLTLRRH